MSWKDRKEEQLSVALRGWETHWEALSTMFEYGPEIRRLIYTTNTIERYNLDKLPNPGYAILIAEARQK